MKYFFPTLMAMVILSGLALVMTPYIAEWYFPATAYGFRQAKPEDSKQALAQWFGTTPEAIWEANTIRQEAAQGNTSWFGFRMERQPVENFIRQHKLRQKILTPEQMQAVFLAQIPPVTWWQPAALQRQTYFEAKDKNQHLGLIYNAEQQQGFLVVRTYKKTNDF